MARRTHARFLPKVAFTLIAALLVLVPAGSAFACGGLITPSGTVSLTRATTLAAYHDGVEHYVTAFEFTGAYATEVGSIVPLPGVPTKVIKGGDWTLRRLILETSPPAPVALAAEDSAPGGAVVLLETQIDALDITVLKGGALDVGTWARDHGFFLPPDAPEVLAFYAQRSPIFMAVKFDVGRANAQGVQQGQGTPVHVVIPHAEPVGAAPHPDARPRPGRPGAGRRIPLDRPRAGHPSSGRAPQRRSEPTRADPGGQ